MARCHTLRLPLMLLALCAFARGEEVAIEEVWLGNALLHRMHVDQLDRNDTKSWRIIFDDLEKIDRSEQNSICWLLEHSLRNTEFIPDLKKLLKNEKVRMNTRSLAAHALHAMHDESEREYVYADLVSAKPALNGWAHNTLGGFQLKERTQSLLELVRSATGEEAAGSAAYRVCCYGAAAPEELIALLGEPQNLKEVERDGKLLEALSLTAPEKALPYVEYIVQHPSTSDQARSWYSAPFAAEFVSRVDLPGARRLAVVMLNRLEGRNLNEFLDALNYSYHQKPELLTPISGTLPRSSKGRESTFPGLTRLAHRSPGQQSRRQRCPPDSAPCYRLSKTREEYFESDKGRSRSHDRRMVVHAA